MSGWDASTVTFSDQGFRNEQADTQGQSRVERKAKLRTFLAEFAVSGNFVYRDQLAANVSRNLFSIEVDLDHLRDFDAELADGLQEHPNDYLDLFADAAREVVLANWPNDRTDMDRDAVPPIQIELTGSAQPISIRSLVSSHIAHMVRLQGIIISASKSKLKANRIALRCSSCQDTIRVEAKPGLGGVTFPRQCQKPTETGQVASTCGLDPYLVQADDSEYVDQQTLKLQERPEDVPTGEMPRSSLLLVERNLVSRVVPGKRVIITGVYSLFQRNQGPSNRSTHKGEVALRNPYIHVLGIEEADDGDSPSGTAHFSQEETEEFDNIAQQDDIYEQLSSSIAPSIFGQDDIKKAITCLLFGGTRRQMHDGTRLRGDINVLLLGDPGTAKSQFLKFVEKIAPVAVYTSGKGSSAAGLTASVIRDSTTREFYLEGGAMVLADGGVVCIDEFDKMREEDRVAIHEAMEQQTISIAKAGITTILNTRTAVLAAANPRAGHYDTQQSAAEQIDFQSTILSRFDMIFIVRDLQSEERDKQIAQHVISIHQNDGSSLNRDDVDLHKLKRYISFARSRIAPTLTADAADRLQDHYVGVRQNAKRTNKGQDSIPITVRQLEAIIRIAESLAKMRLLTEAGIEQVEEAIRLFKISTLDAAQSGYVASEGAGSSERKDRLSAIEKLLQRKMVIGGVVKVARLVNQLMDEGFQETDIRFSIRNMVVRNELDYVNQGKNVRRMR